MLTYASPSMCRRVIPENPMESMKMNDPATEDVAGFSQSGIDREKISYAVPNSPSSQVCSLSGVDSFAASVLACRAASSLAAKS